MIMGIDGIHRNPYTPLMTDPVVKVFLPVPRASVLNLFLQLCHGGCIYRETVDDVEWFVLETLCKSGIVCYSTVHEYWYVPPIVEL